MMDNERLLMCGADYSEKEDVTGIVVRSSDCDIADFVKPMMMAYFDVLTR